MKRIVSLLVIAGFLAACGVAIAKEYPTKPMEFVAPGGAGGGWDLTIRTVAKVLEDTKLVSVPMPITNRPGGGGGVNLAAMQKQRGSDRLVSVYSPPLLLINLNGSSPFGYSHTTPLAGLIADYGAFVVRKDSPYQNINDVLEALKKDPTSVKIAGASSPGSMDHIQFLMVAKAAGVKNLRKINYVSFQDTSAMGQLLGGHVDLFSTGLGEAAGMIKGGEVRVLAITSDHRVEAHADLPTCKEQGVDVEFTNWRGLFGAPNMPDYAMAYWQEVLAKMVKTPEWAEACKRNGWDQKYMNAADFKAFLDKTNREYMEIMEEINMLAAR